MKKLDQKVAVVTGSTSGIGEACARIFAENGAKVVITGRNKENGIRIVSEINAAGGTAIFILCNVCSETEIKAMVKKTLESFEKIDILMNNSGIMLPSSEVEAISTEEWDLTFNTNIRGMFLATKYIKPYLLKSKGVILNNSSIAGLQHYAAGRSYAYSASKAAVIQFSHQLAKNLGEYGVRVNCICPGIIDTPILGDRNRNIYAKKIPLGYVGTPDDVAKAALFLVSDDSAYLTGVVLPVDGGASL